MPNGESAEWHAIDQLRRGHLEVVRDVAVVENEQRGLKEGQEKLDKKLDDHKAAILEAITESQSELDERFNRQRAALLWIVGITMPVITALGTALLSRGG